MKTPLFTVTLADGTVFDQLKLNGNNFVANYVIDPAAFESNCSPVTITCGKNTEVHPYMELVQVTKKADNVYHFILRDVTQNELERIKTRSDIDYIAMMTNVEL